MKTFKLIGFSILAMMALSGCAAHHGPKNCKTVYEFRPPASHEGRTCLMRCDRQRTECRDDKEQEYRNCDHYSRMVALERERCVASGATNCYGAVAPPCEKPCLGGTCGVDQCETEYRFCYQSCGGKVISKEVCSGRSSYSSGCRWGNCDR